MRRGFGTFVVLTVAVLAPTACSEDEGPSIVLPSSALPDDTGSLTAPTGPSGSTGEAGASGPTATIPTEPTGVVPSLPPGSTGNLASGQAAVSVSGDVNANKAMPNLFAGVYAPPPGGMALVWTAGGTDSTTLGLGGLSFTGTQPTAPTLSLTLTIQTSAKIASFTSTAGECSITIGAAGVDQVSGVFTCSDLLGSSGEVVDASGSFAAQG